MWRIPTCACCTTASSPAFMYVTWPIQIWHDSFIRVTWLNHTCNMTPSCVCLSYHSISTCAGDMTNSCVWYFFAVFCRVLQCVAATWRVHMCDMTHLCVWHDSVIWVKWRIHVGDMTHSYVCRDSYVWPDSFICVIGRIHKCDVTHLYVSRDSFIHVPWLIHMYDVTHLHVCHNLHVPLFEHVVKIMSHIWTRDMMHNSSICVTRLILLCDMTHSYVSRDLFICVTWLIHMCAMTCAFLSLSA